MAANCTFTYLDGNSVEDPALRAGLAALLNQLPQKLFSYPGGLFEAARADDVDTARCARCVRSAASTPKVTRLRGSDFRPLERTCSRAAASF